MSSQYRLSKDWIQAMDLEDLYSYQSKAPAKIQDAAKDIIFSEKQQDFKVKGVIQEGGSRALANAASNLEDLKKAILSFDGCALKKGATNTVFSDGNPSASIMLIGEAPGASEDEAGIPFCGESGKLLDNMLKSIGLVRDNDFYITNTIFWRPPANRAPTDEEIAICRPFVEKHIALIKPKLLILVGATAVNSLLGKHLQISKIRQEYYFYSNQYLSEKIPTTALFHPAYLLRQPGQKKASWYDLLKIKDFIYEKK
ncbi:MAG: uracil-DNA glycosylase family protein [Rickettsiaceae bacterium]|nr:uracil-DNA glycosylase family protein [Rickettsiaceae bacterium]